MGHAAYLSLVCTNKAKPCPPATKANTVFYDNLVTQWCVNGPVGLSAVFLGLGQAVGRTTNETLPMGLFNFPLKFDTIATKVYAERDNMTNSKLININLYRINRPST